VPNKESCKKRLRQAEKANAMNRSVRSAIRTSLKVVRGAADKDAALKEMPRLFSLLDKAAAKGRAGFSKNRASNYKAKAAAVVNKLAATATAA
jgi:small subunit ribosomal protein S20